MTMIEMLFALSLLVNAGLIAYSYSIRKQNASPDEVRENRKESEQEKTQECELEAEQLGTDQILTIKSPTSSSMEIPYFKSEKDKLFFLLNEVDGKRRNQLLGITSEMYSDEQLSKQWFRNISNKVHPDKNQQDPIATEAFDNLKKLYSMMTL
ncbi:J domain-containing protein [Shewanella corallii]|uniref:J domain-containing protein n=1 Tax=Shewanella corallii TaxID=560080 RepID=A0ABT0N3M7_9GAMM|nr:J domain-containing protein [Shewanella corallii]MCL2913028.1 J domain-containing protein [Shewanella corallii]